jgi:anthranilate phosphoribosyltransferase
MKTILNKLISHSTLSQDEAKIVLENIGAGSYNPIQISSFLTVFMMRNITIDELTGFRDALLETCIDINLSDYNAVDLCGTGGDGKNTFNISTLASFVTAGAGVSVAKHGNYGVSSVSGSSNVLENLGVKFSNDQNFLEKCIDRTGICILHAPLFHPAMKSVASIRKDLAIKTFFNILGPMVNPSRPQNQITGVYNLELARMYGYLYQNTATRYTILHSLEGYDEISLTGLTKTVSNTSESMISAEDFGVSRLIASDISGGKSVAESVTIFETILSGKGTAAQNHVVCANAAIAISTVTSCSLLSGFQTAMESLLSGKAQQSLRKLQQISAA